MQEKFRQHKILHFIRRAALILGGIVVLCLLFSTSVMSEVEGTAVPADELGAGTADKSSEPERIAKEWKIIERAQAELAVEKSHIEMEKKALEELKKTIEEKRDELEKIRDEIKETIDTTNVIEVEHLVKLYQSMKPKVAATAIELLKPELAAAVLANMRPRQAGKIFNAMKPEKVAELSTIMKNQSRKKGGE